MPNLNWSAFVNLQIFSLCVPSQSLSNIMSLITKDFGHKPLNYAEQIDISVEQELYRDGQVSINFP